MGVLMTRIYKFILTIFILLILSACTGADPKPLYYKVDLVNSAKKIQNISYVTKYYSYFARKKIPIVIAGNIVNYDTVKSEWVFIRGDKGSRIMIDFYDIPKESLPAAKIGYKIKVYGVVIKDLSLLSNYRISTRAYSLIET